MDRLSSGKKFWMGGFPYQIVSSNRLSGWQAVARPRETTLTQNMLRSQPEPPPDRRNRQPNKHATTQNTLQKSTTTGRLESTTQRIMQLIRHSYKERRNSIYKMPCERPAFAVKRLTARDVRDTRETAMRPMVTIYVHAPL